MAPFEKAVKELEIEDWKFEIVSRSFPIFNFYF